MNNYEVTFRTEVEAKVKVQANSEEEAMERIENNDVYDFVHRAYNFSYSNMDLEVDSAREIEYG